MGYFPLAPGTIGSLVAAAVGWFLIPFRPFYLLLTIILLPLGVWSSEEAEKTLGKDSSRIVIDEITGMMVAFFAFPRSLMTLLAALLLFRLFDILKPPPLGRLQEMKGGWGIMVDDLGAGILTNLLLRLLRFGLSTG